MSSSTVKTKQDISGIYSVIENVVFNIVDQNGLKESTNVFFLSGAVSKVIVNDKSHNVATNNIKLYKYFMYISTATNLLERQSVVYRRRLRIGF